MVRWSASILIGLVLFGPATPAADEPAAPPPELVTDRPDSTESASIVTRGYFQFELGWSHAESEIAGIESRADSFPQALARIGLSSRVELRVGFDGYQWDRESAESGESTDRNGFNNTSLGVKVGLFEERGARPQMAFLGQIGVPSGTEKLADDELAPAFRLAFAHTLSERLSLGYNLGALRLTEEDEDGTKKTSTQAIWSVALGIGVTERLGAFVEAFGNPVLSGLGASSSSFDAGFTYLIRTNVQLDAFGGTGLSGDAPDWFAGLGISFRLPR